LADFDVERHPSHREDHTSLPSFFNSSYIGSSSKGALIQGEGTTSEEVQWIDLSHPGRVQRFPSDPVERKERCIFCLVPHQISTRESSGAHFPDIGSAALWADTFGVPERSSDQIQGNPSDPFHSRPRR
jgi:hypothetical protein